jgi:lipoyl-dependent peroxiredoxin subunit D
MSETATARSLAELGGSIGDFGRDIRVNLENVLAEEGAPGLSAAQQWGVALAAAYALQNQELASAVRQGAESKLPAEVIEAAKSAATIMAMNNVYYRFLHFAEDKNLSQLPAKLRMMVIGKPGIAKLDFELMSLGVSAINACGKCINAHIEEARKAGISDEGIQSVVRIAAVLNAAKQALSIPQ